MPPWRAIAMAMRDSVTVSMALDSSGMRSESSRVSRVVVSTSLGMTSVSPGSSRTSSKVSPSGGNVASYAASSVLARSSEGIIGAFRVAEGERSHSSRAASRPRGTVARTRLR